MFLDTTIIVEILRGEAGSQRMEIIIDNIRDEPLFMSMAQIAELGDWCIKNDIEPLKRIDQIKEIINIIPLNEKICLEGAGIKHIMRKKGLKKFSLMDGMILASARSVDQKLLTSDNDFRKVDDTILIR